MSQLPSAISVVMRNYNEGWAIGETIRQLFAQDYPGDIEWVVIDSGSTDDSLEIIRAAETPRPAKIIQIPPGTYVPGVVLNQGVRETSHEWIVFLNADATPQGKDWLRHLLSPCLDRQDFGAAYSRQVPRPGCQAVYAHDYHRCFGPDPLLSPPWNGFFSMVSSISRRSVLERFPFREDLQYAEDNEWARRMHANGLGIFYLADSVVAHSHNYTPAQAYKRSYGDAKAMSAAGSLSANTASLRVAMVSAARAFARDVRWMVRRGRMLELPYAALVRLQQRLGHRAGYLDGKPDIESKP